MKQSKKKNTISNNLPNSNNIVNIDSYLNNGNPTISPKDGYFELSFYMTDSIFYNDSEYNRFIKAVEKMIRTSDYYKEYIATLKMQYGLNHCMILGNIDDADDVDIEMHHGPLMTLYDIVALIVNDRLAKKQKVDTFKITDIVLREHYDMNVQVIMLSKTVHELVHKGKIFIHYSQCIGDINTLLDKYSEGITEELAKGINAYIDLCNHHKSTDNGLLVMGNDIVDWSNGNGNSNLELS